MAQQVIVMTVGDLKPNLVQTIKDDDGTAIVFDASDTVFFRLTNVVTGVAALNDVTAAISTPASGIVTYDWTGSDTSVAGEYRAEWKIKYAAGDYQHIKYPFPIVIREVA